MVSDMPLILLTDFATAFPAICQRFMAKVLETAGLPIGMRAILAQLYRNSLAYFRSAEGKKLLFEITSGIMQGCPASGFIFAVASCPIIEFINFVLMTIPHQFEELTACADDLGLALASLSALR